MEIKQIKDNKKQFIDLLLLADEQESMVDKYLERGDMFALYDPDLKAECVITDEGNGIYEIKNIATDPKFQGRGYGKKLINFLFEHYQNKCTTMLVGTGDSPLSIPFYCSCGFAESHRIKNFFIDNYDHPIIEGGKQLVDMVYLIKDLSINKSGGMHRMKIGIIGAMDEEINIIKSRMQEVTIKKAASMEFFEGKFQGKDVVAVRCGIGKVNGAVCTQILADLYHVEAVINTGVAGALRNEIDVADIVLSTDALQHDMDATGFGYEPGVIPRMESSIFRADVRLLKLAKEVCEEVIPEVGVYSGRVVSGDQFISDSSKKAWLVEKFNGFCTEMEGAAIAQTAYLNQIPFLIIRAVSDKADHSAEMAYSLFEELAIRNTIKLVTGLIARI